MNLAAFFQNTDIAVYADHIVLQINIHCLGTKALKHREDLLTAAGLDLSKYMDVTAGVRNNITITCHATLELVLHVFCFFTDTRCESRSPNILHNKLCKTIRLLVDYPASGLIKRG